MHQVQVNRQQRHSSACVLTALLLCGVAQADDTWWHSTKERLERVAEQPGWDLYLSGYAYHSRSTYSSQRVQALNERAWGGGIGRTMRNEQGDDESLYLIGFRDSKSQPHWMLGYAYQWTRPLGDAGLEGSLGFTAALMRRRDWGDGWPVPVVLPVASLGTARAKLVMTFVPRLSTSKGRGNVLLLVGRLSFQ
jgi:palmitoyl transferase